MAGAAAVAAGVESDPVGVEGNGRDLGSVHVLRPGLPSLLHQELVEVRPVPVRVGHLVVGAGRDQELIAALRIGSEGPVERWP